MTTLQKLQTEVAEGIDQAKCQHPVRVRVVLSRVKLLLSLSRGIVGFTKDAYLCGNKNAKTTQL